jgi:hypothetical protein
LIGKSTSTERALDTGYVRPGEMYYLKTVSQKFGLFKKIAFRIFEEKNIAFGILLVIYCDPKILH